MKKIGILFGMEESFPKAFVERVNQKNVKNVTAELLQVGEVMQAIPSGYDVIFDRISQDVPFYRAFLKNAALTGAVVINNPFWWSADEKFFNNCLAEKIGVPVPKTVLLPSKDMPDDTSEQSFRNLKFPLDWQKIYEYLGGFPFFMKPHSGGGWKNVYKVHNEQELFNAYHETGRLVMMLQEAIEFDSYFRCYCIGRKHVRIMHYEPRNPHHLRYDANHQVSDEQIALMEKYVLDLNKALGYDFNTVEFAFRDGIPYAIDFCNPAPDAEKSSVGEENFEWVVETAANFAIEKAQEVNPEKSSIDWGSFVLDSTSKEEKGRLAPKKNKTKADPAQQLLAKIGKGHPDKKDDLKKLKGVGPKLEKMLHQIGVFSFLQVSKMGEKEYLIIDTLIESYKGRAKKDDWAGQAKKLL